MGIFRRRKEETLNEQMLREAGIADDGGASEPDEPAPQEQDKHALEHDESLPQNAKRGSVPPKMGEQSHGAR